MVKLITNKFKDQERGNQLLEIKLPIQTGKTNNYYKH